MISLFDVPHRTVRAALDTGAPVFLAVNPVEYHGPHLPLHCDALISQGMSKELHAKLAEKHPDWPFIVGANIEMGVEPCPGPGTRAVPYGVVKEVVVDACKALADIGAKRVILMTFHGAPLHNLALEAGVRYLKTRGVEALAPLHVVLRQILEFLPDENGKEHEDPPWLDLVAPAYANIADEAERREMMRNIGTDFHAGFFETSVCLHYAPESVSKNLKTIPPCPPFGKDARLAFASRMAKAIGATKLARELEFGALGMGWYLLRPFPGYTGKPHHANKESGAYFARFMIDRYFEAAEAVFTKTAPSPEPIMSWVATASFGGRAGGVHVPLEAIGGVD